MTGVCDICNAPGTGTVVGAEQMREAVFRRGFNPFKMGLVVSPMILMLGEREAYEQWKNTIVAQDTSDWNICAKCMAKLEPYLREAPKATGVRESTVSFDPGVRAAAGAAAEQKYRRVTDAAAPAAAPRQKYKLVTDPAAPAAAPRQKYKLMTDPVAPPAVPRQRYRAETDAAAPEQRPVAKEPPKKRRLPVWAIVLLVLGTIALVAAGWAFVGSFLAPSKEIVVVQVPVTQVITVQPAEAEPTLAAIPAQVTEAPVLAEPTLVPEPTLVTTPMPETEALVREEPTLTPVPQPSPTPSETPVPTTKPTAKPSPVPTHTPLPPPTPTRDLSTLEKALLGHWVTESGVTNFYIGPGTMIMVEPSGVMHLTWTRFEGNDEDDWMKIYVHRPDTGGGHYKLLRFAPDRLSLVSETNITQKWLYVDSRQEP